MVNECTCGIDAHSFPSDPGTDTCECEENCSCECEVCECDNDSIDLWGADSNSPLVCACGGNCSCGEISGAAN